MPTPPRSPSPAPLELTRSVKAFLAVAPPARPAQPAPGLTRLHMYALLATNHKQMLSHARKRMHQLVVVAPVSLRTQTRTSAKTAQSDLNVQRLSQNPFLALKDTTQMLSTLRTVLFAQPGGSVQRSTRKWSALRGTTRWLAV